jgi:hypothetical protein
MYEKKPALHRIISCLELNMPLGLCPYWQNRQSLAIRVTDLAICGQQNLAVMRRRVAHTP